MPKVISLITTELDSKLSLFDTDTGHSFHIVHCLLQGKPKYGFIHFITALCCMDMHTLTITYVYWQI